MINNIYPIPDPVREILIKFEAVKIKVTISHSQFEPFHTL